MAFEISDSIKSYWNEICKSDWFFPKTKYMLNNYGAKASAGFLGILSLYDFFAGNYERFAMEASLSAILYKTASFYKTERHNLDEKHANTNLKEMKLTSKEMEIELREKALEDFTKFIQEQNEILLKAKERLGDNLKNRNAVYEAFEDKAVELKRTLDYMATIVSYERELVSVIKNRQNMLEIDDPDVNEILAKTGLDHYLGRKKVF